MTHIHHPLRRSIYLLGLLATLTLFTVIPVAAADHKIVFDEVYHFSCEDFSPDDASAAPRGVLLTSVPDTSIGTLYLGSRQLSPGDAISASALDRLRFEPSGSDGNMAEFKWLPVFAQTLSKESSMLIEISNGKNQPPTAEDSTIQTYRNIPIDGQLVFQDPDDEEWSFSLRKEPKYGSVSINRNGSYIYTPKKNKVGKDQFTVQITDRAGNTADATVKVTILKPTDKTTFADLNSGSDQYVAMWLREQGVYAGRTLSGTLLFQPEQKVSRGEFLVMAMDLLDIAPDDTSLSTGFADEAQTPEWLRPYLVTALRSGFISGVDSPEGLCFRPDASITQAEAAVILQNMLGIDSHGTVTVFSSDEIPAWAADAVTCLNEHGITELRALAEPMTMRETAHLLYQVYGLWSSNQLSSSLLAWAADA